MSLTPALRRMRGRQKIVNRAEAQQHSRQGEPAPYNDKSSTGQAPSEVSRQERRRLKNERKRERKQAEQHKGKTKKYLKWLGWLAVSAAVVAGLGKLISDQEILPPTSALGHTEVSPQSHISTVPFSLNVQKHMLEHSDGSGPPGIFINYNCEQFDCEPGFADNLAKFVEEYPQNVYVAPYKNMAAKLVLTRQGRQDILDGFDEQRIRDFIER